MSWEEMSIEKYPCPCGKSTYTVTKRMDDWNRTDSLMHMDCEECHSKYVLFCEDYCRSGLTSTAQFWISKQTQAEYSHLCDEATAFRQKAKVLRTGRHLPMWKTLFEGKNKRQAWAILTGNGARYPALGTFYQHTKVDGLGAYLLRHFENADDRTFTEIMKILGIDDAEISGLMKQAKELEKEARDLAWREKFPQ
jgi:hypothetical protein